MNTLDLTSKLAAIGQSATLRFLPQLPAPEQEQLLSQLSALDLDAIPDLVRTYVTGKYIPPIPSHFDPVTPLPATPQTPEQRKMYADAQALGQALLREGKVAAFLVAGGQGTRLGYDGPKGEYPVTPIGNKSLFHVFAEQLLTHSRIAGRSIPWYIMTSDINDAATRAFFQKHGHFGYDSADIFFFQQGMMPAFAMTGELLLASASSLALSPGGNGDCYRSLLRTGALADMRKRGVEHLAYFAVDNPMVHIIDPLFLGLHALGASDMSSKACPKAAANERVGNFAIADGKLQVIEYSDIPAEVAAQTNADGSLRYNSGNIGIHIMRLDFIERLNAGGRLQLPWHRAEKKVAFVDQGGTLVKPEQNNAVKLEQFVFDALLFANNPVVFTTQRAEEFSPVKNAEGIDSPATSKRDQIRRHARWLESAGVTVPRTSSGEPDAVIEISPLYAATGEQLRSRKPAISIKPGDRVYLPSPP